MELSRKSKAYVFAIPARVTCVQQREAKERPLAIRTEGRSVDEDGVRSRLSVWAAKNSAILEEKARAVSFLFRDRYVRRAEGPSVLPARTKMTHKAKTKTTQFLAVHTVPATFRAANGCPIQNSLA
jgi:hypothetical protein